MNAWSMYVLIRGQGRKNILDLINDYSDDIGGGRRGTKSSLVHAGCSLETKDMDEISL